MLDAGGLGRLDPVQLDLASLDLGQLNPGQLNHGQTGARAGLRPSSGSAPPSSPVEAELGDLARRVRFEAKATVFEEGAPTEAVWSLVSGVVLLSKLLQDGRRQVLGIALPGDFLGLSLQACNRFTASALTPATLCRCEQARFAALLEAAPHLMRQVLAACAGELSRAQDHMSLLGRRSAEEKVAAFLLSLRLRWAPVHGLSARVDLPMTRQDIGDYLGLTLETVSRSMTRLARRKLIAVIPDGVRILDLDGLEAAAGLRACA